MRMSPTPKNPSGSSPAAVVARDLDVLRASRVALRGVTLELGKGQSLAVIGPNGSGKSTFLRALAGLLETRGHLRVAANAERGGVAMVFQGSQVDPHLPMTAREAVALGRLPHMGLLRRRTRADIAAVEGAMERMDVADLAGEQLATLSGGQMQRVLVAQALAQDAELVLLDEPLTGVDVNARAQILGTIDSEVKRGIPVVISTHDLADAAACDRVLLVAGHQVAFGTPAEVLVEEHLAVAFGGRVLQAIDGSVVLDDPHHHHEAGHGERR